VGGGGAKKFSHIFTHLTDVEKITLYRIARKIRRKATIVEIGSYLGASSCFLATGLKNGCIYCIDTWQNDAMTEGQKDTYSAFMENTKDFADKIIPIRGWSYDVIDRINEKLGTDKIDILFIDGDHSYDGVKKDWDLYSPLLGKKSVVIFHDYGWAEGVKKVVHDDVIKKCKIYEALPNMWWGQIK